VIGVLGTVVLLLAGTNPLKLEEEFSNYLLILAYWIAPWLAIVISDFYLFHKGRYETASLYRNNGVRWAGLIAYVVGIVVSIPFWSQTNFTGFIAAKLQGADITYYVGFLVAGGLYLVLARPRTATAASPSRSVQGSQAR
jgi:NCS1 family nucleobase:cation symporter-1